MIRAWTSRAARVAGAGEAREAARGAGGLAAWRRAKRPPARSVHSRARSGVPRGEDRSQPPASARTHTWGSEPSSRRAGTGMAASRKRLSAAARRSARARMRTTAPALRTTRRRRGLCRRIRQVAGSTAPEARARSMWGISAGSEATPPHWIRRPEPRGRIHVGRPRPTALAAALSAFEWAVGHRTRAQPAGAPEESAREELTDTPGLMRTRVATRASPTAPDRRSGSSSVETARARDDGVMAPPSRRRRRRRWPPTPGTGATRRAAARAARRAGRAPPRSTRPGWTAAPPGGRG